MQVWVLELHMLVPMQDDVICHPLILALLVGASLAPEIEMRLSDDLGIQQTRHL